MSFEFQCNACGSSTIFHDYSTVKKRDRVCANCEESFTLEKDLIRFDRSDKDKIGMLIPPENTLSERLKAVCDRVNELDERMGRLESLILESRESDEDEDAFHQVMGPKKMN